MGGGGDGGQVEISCGGERSEAGRQAEAHGVGSGVPEADIQEVQIADQQRRGTDRSMPTA